MVGAPPQSKLSTAVYATNLSPDTTPAPGETTGHYTRTHSALYSSDTGETMVESHGTK